MRQDIKKCCLLKEFSIEEIEKYFSCKEDKVINNIDTFYYSCFLSNDSNSNCFELLGDLETFKKMLEKSNEKFLSFKDSEFIIVKKGFSIYKYCLSIDNYFDVFISNYLPNLETPRIVVQLRSIALWTKGVEYCILDSLNSLTSFLNSYGQKIVATRENRIDYAYHTNSIQNAKLFFSDEKIEKHCFTKFKMYMKVGKISPGKVTIDYFSLGRRGSNNLFIRMYNKTREVFELGYKQIFIDIWFKFGLISFYDKFVYEFCYNAKSWEQQNIGKLYWYLEYGKDNNLKNYCADLIDKYFKNPKKLDNILNGWFPSLTVVHNIEFQTKRKFYSTCDKMISILPVEYEYNSFPVLRLFQILDNRNLFLNYLTCDSLRFVKDSTSVVNFKDGDVPEYLRWWNCIRKCKLTKYGDMELTREYLRNMDIEKIRKEIENKISTLSLYLNRDKGLNQNFKEDLSDYLCYYNDNDVSKNLVFIDSSTGEILKLSDKACYQLKKEKKYKSLKPLLNSDSYILK